MVTYRASIPLKALGLQTMSFSGVPAIYGINHLKESTDQKHQLGTIGFTSDGRKFRYAKAGATLVAGDLIATPAESTDTQSIVVAAAAIGATSVTTTGNVTADANEFADGYLVATGEASTGTGILYRIKSHPAASAATAKFELHDAIKVAFTATTQIDIIANPYSGVIQWPTTASGAPAGVATIALTSGSYGWLQTGGLGAVLSEGGDTVGQSVVASNGTAGAVEDTASTTQAVVGVRVTGVATGEVGAINLQID